MSITLTDIPAAVEDYLRDNVIIHVSRVTPEDPDRDVLAAGQAAHFTVTATNGDDASGVRLTNVLYHVEINRPQTLQLAAPGQLVVVAFEDPNKARPIERDVLVGEMYVENSLETALDAGQVGSPLNLVVRCIDRGRATITVHVRADIDTDDLFRTAHSRGRQQTADVA